MRRFRRDKRQRFPYQSDLRTMQQLNSSPRYSEKYTLHTCVTRAPRARCFDVLSHNISLYSLYLDYAFQHSAASIIPYNNYYFKCLREKHWRLGKVVYREAAGVHFWDAISSDARHSRHDRFISRAGHLSGERCGVNS